MPSIRDNLFQLWERIHAFEDKYQRPRNSVSLVAMSKGQPVEKLEQAIAAGQRIFGENFVQEALAKMEKLGRKDLEWHFTGTLQSNKTRLIAEHFSWVHTVTSTKVAQRLNDQRSPHLSPLPVCLEVNISGEASKSGLKEIEEVEKLANDCLALPHLKLRGLMTIPKQTALFEEQRAELHRLRLMKEHLNRQGITLDTLSMGMTDDLEAAIAEGATLIRIGRGLFGERVD